MISSSPTSKYAWVVLNQSQSPQFQAMIERLAESLGRCLLVTGMPFDSGYENLHVKKGPAYVRRSIRMRAESWGMFTLFSLSTLLHLRGSPLVFAVTNPPFLPYLAWLFRHVKKMPYVLLIWDIYPDHLVKLGWFSERSIMTRTWNFVNSKTLANAEAVITLGEGMADVLKGHCSTLRKDCNVFVIPNWTDTRKIRPLPKRHNAFAVDNNQTDKTTLMYSGNIGATHGLESIVQAAALLQEMPKLDILFVGDGLGRDSLIKETGKLQISNVKFIDYQPWERLPLSLATGDVAIISQSEGSESLSVPSKTYSALAAGSAILALTSSGSDLASMVHEHNIGIVCSDRSPHAIAAGIKSIVKNKKKLGTFRRNARKAALALYSEDMAFEKFRAILDPLINKYR